MDSNQIPLGDGGQALGGGWGRNGRHQGAVKDSSPYGYYRDRRPAPAAWTPTQTPGGLRVSGRVGARIPQAWERENPGQGGKMRPTAQTNGDTRL